MPESSDETRSSLRALETRFSGFVEAFPGLLVTMSPTGTVEHFSGEVLEYFGKTAEDLRGWQMNNAIHPDDLPRVIAAYTESVATGQPYTTEHRCRRADGVYRWFQVRALAVSDENQQLAGWYVVLVDIDDLKRAEGAMRRNERHLTETIDALRRSQAYLLEVQRVSHTGGWRFDVAAGIVDSSPEVQRAYDVQPGEDISGPSFWFGRMHPEDRPGVEAEFERAVRDKREYQVGFRIVCPNGTIRYLYATGHPILNDAGEVAEFFGATMDMTAHWLATTELAHTTEALRELQATMSRAAQIATVGEFAASVAHEINQPLSGIITNANTCLRMLAAEPPNISGARETARRTLRDGNRASDVLTRLRALFSRKEPTLEVVDLNDATREVVALTLSELLRNRVKVHSELGDDLPRVVGNRVQLQQVILNLLRNASDAMAGIDDRPRCLTIRTGLDEGDGVRLSVHDVGVGFSQLNAEKLFEPFYTTKPDGMGIGLSVSRSIMDSHNGRLLAERNDGPGATFVLFIPRAPQPPARPRTARIASTLRRSAAR